MQLEPRRRKAADIPANIAKGMSRKVARSLGAPQSVTTAAKPVQVVPVKRPAGMPLSASVAPLFSPGRLTVATAIQSARRTVEAKNAKVSPGARARIVARERIGAKNAAKASTSHSLAINPPDPAADRATGRLRQTDAFSRHSWRVGFAKSYHLRRGYG